MHTYLGAGEVAALPEAPAITRWLTAIYNEIGFPLQACRQETVYIKKIGLEPGGDGARL